jgi:hypothetical protein
VYDLRPCGLGRPATHVGCCGFGAIPPAREPLRGGRGGPGHPIIQAFAKTVMDRFTIEDVDIWGPFAYVTGINRIDRDADPIALLAVEHGLVCYDPQAEVLVP